MKTGWSSISNPNPIVILPRLSLILHFKNQIYNNLVFKQIFDYGIIEYCTIHANWKVDKIDEIRYMAFKIILANPDEIYSFINKMKNNCWKLECWLIRKKKSPKLLYSHIKSRGDIIIEEDFFWELEDELYDKMNARLPLTINN